MTFYDLEHTVIEAAERQAGDVSVRLSGGHGYEILGDGNIL